MKLYKIYITIISICLVGFSCKKTFFSEVNNNPNAVLNVPPNLLLPTVEATLGYTQSGDFSRTASLFDQQTFGLQNQPAATYKYGANAGTFESQWDDIYTSVMENDYSLIKIADGLKDNAYSGIGRILLAYSLQLTVDTWGSVPYSTAFQGNMLSSGGTLHPAFDNDNALYDTITKLINVGIAQLSNTGQDILVPGSDDGIYNGDATKWIKFGHAIKARLYIHQSKGDAAMANNALAEADKSFTNNEDNAQFIFDNSETGANSWYQFGRDRQGYITFSNSSLASILLSLHDPRYPVYIDSLNDGNGNSASGTYYGGLPDYYGAANSPTEFIMYDELLFLKAEATLRSSGNIATAQTFYQQAITANMQKLGISATDITTYIIANGSLPANINNAISKVAIQEYIALYLNPEAWTLWRRTGSPNLKPTSTGAIPRRLIYPQSEYSFNAVNTPASTLYTSKIFWDK